MFEPCSSVVAGPLHAGQVPTNDVQQAVHHDYLLHLDPALVNARLPDQPVAVSVQQVTRLIWHLASYGHNGQSGRTRIEMTIGAVPVGVLRVWGGRLRREREGMVLTILADVATACHTIMPVHLQLTYRNGNGRAECVKVTEII